MREHNWNDSLDFCSCLTCGCAMWNIFQELTPQARGYCPGRTPEFQARRDAAFADLRAKAKARNKEIEQPADAPTGDDRS